MVRSDLSVIAHSEYERRVAARVIAWMHALQERDGSLNGHKLSISFRGRSVDIREEHHLETITFPETE